MCSFQTLSAARAEADTIRLLGESQAKSREMIGLAEAEGMRLKATSYKQYGEAATLSLVLDILPRVRLPLLYALRSAPTLFGTPVHTPSTHCCLRCILLDAYYKQYLQVSFDSNYCATTYQCIEY